MMLCIFAGRPALSLADLTLQVTQKVAPPVWGARREARGQSQQVDLVAPDQPVLSTTPQIAVISPRAVKRRAGPSDAKGNPTVVLAPITMADFLPGHLFGNGITVGATVQLVDGQLVVLSWCVHDDSQQAVVRANYAALQALFEG